MPDKKVSIYINVYNGEEHIRETVDSILNQTYKNFELIIVNDCSTDSTLDILNAYSDSRIKVYSLEENSHIATALNYALRRCSGEYVAHCDGDDLWRPEKLEKQVAFMESNPEYGACFTHISIIDADSKTIDDSGLYGVYNIQNMPRHEMLYFFMNHSNHLSHSAFLARKSVTDKVGEYDYSMPTLHDFDYWLRLLTVAPIGIIEEKLNDVRMHGNSASSMTAEKWNSHDSEYIRTVKKALTLCPDGLFLRAFEGELHFAGEHTSDEVKIEKALIAGKINIPQYYNPVISIEMLSELMNSEKTRRLLKEKFSFTPHDLYRLEESRQYHHTGEYKSLTEKLEEQCDIAEEQKQRGDEYETLNKALKQQVEALSAVAAEVTSLREQLSAVQASFAWRLTKPIRVCGDIIKNTLQKRPGLLNLCILTKCFLRYGYSAAKAKRIQMLENAPLIVKGLAVTKAERAVEEGTVFERKIKFSILVPLYNTPESFLKEMIGSVLKQTYGNFELCLADGSTEDFAYVGEYCKKISKKDKRIKYKRLDKNGGISANTNECFNMATGDYIALFDHDDILHPSVLFEYARAINGQNADFIYCDEDKFNDTDGEFYDRYFKPDFAPDNLRANNYICHFTVFKRSLLNNEQLLISEFDGSQDHDLVLRLTERAEKIVHIPRILYHWRVSAASVASDPYAKEYTIQAGIKAVSRHLERVGLKGSVESSRFHPNFYRIKYDIDGNPLVSILIPNCNHTEILKRCVDSIISKSTYTNYEIIIIENNSNKRTFAYYDSLKQYPNVRVIEYKPTPNEFNYSKINNYGFRFARGEHIILLNNDIEVITPGWIEEMLMFSQRKDVGAVGAMLYYPDDTIQHAGVILGIGGVAGHAFKYFKRGSTGYFGRTFIQQNYSAVTAACLMLKSEVYKEINGFDESFKVAFNDVDLCMRIRKAGYLICFTPYAELYHHESVSRGAENTSEKVERFNGEVERFKARWADELEAGDPYYNKNLTLVYENFGYK